MSEVTLISEDGIKFYVSISVVRCIGLFKNLLDLSAGAPLPPLQVPNVTSLILEKIIEYLKNYVATRDTMAAISSAGGATNVRKTQAAPLKVKLQFLALSLLQQLHLEASLMTTMTMT